MKLIVVGYDGTAPAERALRRAAELAQAFSSRLIIVDVSASAPLAEVPVAPGAFGLSTYGFQPSEQDRQVNERLQEQHRARAEAFCAEAGVPLEFAGLVGDPAYEIVDVANQRHADLIVVGTREPGFVERLVGGSVSQGVARRAHCDVLIVHPGNDAAAEQAPAANAEPDSS